MVINALYRSAGRQPCAVQATYADVDELVQAIDYKPAMSVEEGRARFVDWYRTY
jgi:UDP-glucuronate 4-epimerase